MKAITFFQFVVKGYEDEGLYTAILTEDEFGIYWSVSWMDEDEELNEADFEQEHIVEYITNEHWTIETFA